MAVRNAKGQFEKGYSGGPGRPKKSREERYLEITKSAVTFENWKKIVIKAADQASHGDAQARKWLSDYLVGPPIQKQEISGVDGNAIEVNQIELTDDDRASRIEAILDKARERRDRQAGEMERPTDTPDLSEAA